MSTRRCRVCRRTRGRSTGWPAACARPIAPSTPMSFLLAGIPATLCLALFVSTFLHEYVAFAAATYYIVEHRLTLTLAAAAVFAGIIVGDWSIYGIGVAARLLPRVRRWTISATSLRSPDWIDRHLILLVVLSRLLPGVIFPTFTALGYVGAS